MARRTKTRVLIAVVLALAASAVAASAAQAVSYTIAASAGAAYVPGTSNNLFPTYTDDAVVRLSTTNPNPARVLPFRVKAYGTTYSSIAVSSNGNIQFGTPTSTAYTNVALPTTTLPRSLCVYWDDLIIDPNNSGGVLTKIKGTKPNRQFIISWRAYAIGSADHIRAEVIFNEANAKLTTIYAADPNFPGELDGASATVGIQMRSPTFSNRTQYEFNNAASIFPGLKLVYTPH
jgi:hypothetical protein